MNVKRPLTIYVVSILVVVLWFGSCVWADTYNPDISGLTKLYNDYLYMPAVSQNGEKISYFYNLGAKPAGFYELDLATKKTKMISTSMDTPDYVFWSPDRCQVVLLVTYHSYIFQKYKSCFLRQGARDGESTYWLYDFTKHKLIYLSINKFFAWSPDGKNLLCLISRHDREENADLVILDHKSLAKKKIYKAKNNLDYFGGWIDNKNVYYAEFPTDARAVLVPIFSINIDSSRWMPIMETKHIPNSAITSPDKTKIFLVGQDDGTSCSLYSIDLFFGQSDIIIKDIDRSAVLYWYDLDKIFIIERSSSIFDINLFHVKQKNAIKMKNIHALDVLRRAISSEHAGHTDFLWSAHQKALYINVQSSLSPGLYRFKPKIK